MFGFLLTRRWIGLLLAVAVLSTLAVLLGRWQFSRLDERQERNDRTEAALAADPVPAESLLAVGSQPRPSQEWRRVIATGRYDPDETVLVIFRTRSGRSGVDVVTPLVLPSGTALLVDRGWWETNQNVNEEITVPAPPEGVVTVTGWIRRDATDSPDETTPVDQKVRAISSTAIGPTLPYPVYGGFVDLVEETPAPTKAPERADAPDLGSGPHFFYGLQWFFFALLAIGGLVYFVWLELQDRNRSAQRRTTESSPATDRV